MLSKAKYQLTEQQKHALRKQLDRLAAKTAPRIKVLDDGKATKISLDHPDQVIGRGLLLEALGTADDDFGNGLLRQLANTGSKGGKIDEGELNFMLSVIKDIKPKDQLEAMLAAQMAAVHRLMMKFARQLEQVENLAQQDSAERALNKLARTYTTQMEALKRYRSGGEQKVTVQHVSVSEGGQAIVGNVTQAGRDAAEEKPGKGPPALIHAQTPIVEPIVKEERAPVALRRRHKDGGSSST